jgi:UDP-N-acetylmuramoylalanine--D-glutamate ligase
MPYRGQRVTVMGLGHFGGGVAAARWLAAQGAIVTVTDMADETTLAAALTELADCTISAFHLGGHREEDFRKADLVVVNPAVRPQNPWLAIARENGVRLTTEIDLFLAACPAASIGVTGSNGKSTTAAMIDAILQADGRRTWLGGNIGGSLLDRLDEIQPGDGVVLELSSFQLSYLRPETPIPQISVITSFSPNHLDWHANMDEYAAAKQTLLHRQRPNDVAVLNTHDCRLAAWDRHVRGRLLPLVPDDELPGLRVPGRHNRMNAACAATAALAAGCSREAIDRGLKAFRGLPQRMEFLGEIQGRGFYNDSTSTTPESTIAALESVGRPAILLAGGHDKGFDFSQMIEMIGRSAVGAAFFGEIGPGLHDRLTASGSGCESIAVPALDEALDWSWHRSQAGDAIVLSPGCSSHDQFRNFRERGERFAELVRGLGKKLGVRNLINPGHHNSQTCNSLSNPVFLALVQTFSLTSASIFKTE